jgi:hypothetical protein
MISLGAIYYKLTGDAVKLPDRAFAIPSTLIILPAGFIWIPTQAAPLAISPADKWSRLIDYAWHNVQVTLQP